MESSHDEDGNKQVSGDSETRSRSSSSSSSSSSYSSPPKHLPEDDKESSSNDPEVSQIDSPRVQVMDRDDNNGSYDPNRIPSSVFERSKSNIPAEWSCASNESLFSIHIGRNSFTVDMMKSGELYKSGELLAYSPALPMPPPPGGETKSKVVDSDDEKVLVVEETHKSKTSNKEEEEKKEQHPAVSWKTPTTSYRSTRSSNSTHSFSFPILAGAASESGKKETEEHKKKQVKQTQDSQQAADVANQKQTMCKWLSCFPSCPWCCYSHSSCSCT